MGSRRHNSAGAVRFLLGGAMAAAIVGLGGFGPQAGVRAASATADGGGRPALHPTPLSVLIDLDAIEAGAPLPALPIWIDSFEIAPSALAAPPIPRAAAVQVDPDPSWDDPLAAETLPAVDGSGAKEATVAWQERELVRTLLPIPAGTPTPTPAAAPEGAPGPAAADGPVVMLSPTATVPRPRPAAALTGPTVIVAPPAGDMPQEWMIARVRLVPGVFPGDTVVIRVLFDDLAGHLPVVTAWTELGVCLFQSPPLGDGTGLPTSETVAVPAQQAATIEIALPGAGANLRGVFLAPATARRLDQAMDFAARPPVLDPFKALLPTWATPTTEVDAALFGRVAALIDGGTVGLRPTGSGRVAYEFELAEVPAAALFTFELLNADPAAPPQVELNGAAWGPAYAILPDLADPAYDGRQYAAADGLRWRYRGWVTCQKFLPGAALVPGVNRLLIAAPDTAAGTAIRAVAVQLKYPWYNRSD